MKKTLLGTLLALLMVFVMAFAGCGFSKKDAEKINEKAKEGKHYTYEELIRKYDEPVSDATGDSDWFDKSGVVIWIEDCDDWEDVYERREDGKNIEALVVTFANGKAILAVYHENYTESAK